MAALLAARSVVVVFTAAPGLSFVTASSAHSSNASSHSPNASSASLITLASASLGVVTNVAMALANTSILVTIDVSGLSVNTLPVSTTVIFTVQIEGVDMAGAAPDCSGPGSSGAVSNSTSPLRFWCSLSPLKSQSPTLKKAVQTTFRSTTAVSGLLMNPVTAMANTGMISIRCSSASSATSSRWIRR